MTFPMSSPKLVSLFSGTGALDLAVTAATGAETVAVADVCGEPQTKNWPHKTPCQAPCTILNHRFPGVPNLGDVSTVDWSAFLKTLSIDDIVMLCAGFPCQDVSTAGKRAGLKDGTRTGLWSEVVRAIRELQPRLVVLENVPGIFTAPASGDVEPCEVCLGDAAGEHLRALHAVLADLAEVRFDAEWVCVPASGVGAPHKRLRWFLLAYPAGNPWRLKHGDGPIATNPASDGRVARGTESAGLIGRSDAAQRGDADLVLLKTPTSQLAVNGGSQHPDKRKEGGHGPTLADEVEHLLGTPTARMWKGSGPVGSASHEWLLDHGNVEAQVLLLPTPMVKNNENRQSDGYGPNLGEALALLPTPAVNDMGRAYTPEEWDAWTAKMQAAHGNGNGHGKSLEIEAARLLPTPTTQPTTGNGHARNLGTESRHLPTPAVADVQGGRRARSGDRGGELLLNGIAAEQRFGEYGPAISRWEAVIGRRAPDPTSPTDNYRKMRTRRMARTDPKPAGMRGSLVPTMRLSPAFTEWMMGLPAGWITDVPGITHNEALKACGNGVVPQQASAALRHMLAAVSEAVA
jgi:DNA (cytosine-5)-methyltransferase 1